MIYAKKKKKCEYYISNLVTSIIIAIDGKKFFILLDTFRLKYGSVRFTMILLSGSIINLNIYLLM